MLPSGGMVYSSSSASSEASIVLVPPSLDAHRARITGAEKSLMQRFLDMDLPSIAQKLHDTHILTASSIIVALIKAPNTATRAAHLLALAELFTDKPLMSTIMQYSVSFPDIVFALKSLYEGVPETSVQTSEDGMSNQAASSPEEIELQPLNCFGSLMDKVPEASAIGAWLRENVTAVRILCGIVSLIACMFGVERIINVSDKGDFMQKVIKLGYFVRSGKTIMSALGECTDQFLPFIYNLFGETYYKPELLSLKQTSDKVAALHKRIEHLRNQIKIDFFGFQMRELAAVMAEYKGLYDAFTVLTLNDKSMFNLSQRVSDIHQALNSLNELIINIHKTNAGKQRPVTLWFCGRAGVGKTRISGYIAHALAENHNSGVYARTWSDEYWSGYNYQQVVTMDDMLQLRSNAEQRDLSEFMRYTSEDAKDVIGAAIQDKGTPFAAKHIICTSNYMWITPPQNLTCFEAANRRRDAVFYMFNPDVTIYKETHNGCDPPPDWYADHPTRYFQLNPLWGCTIEHNALESTLQFRPDADYVIREWTLDEIVSAATELEKQRREIFRQRLIEVGVHEKLDMPIPSKPIQFDTSKMFTLPTREGTTTRFCKGSKNSIKDYNAEHFTEVSDGSFTWKELVEKCGIDYSESEIVLNQRFFDAKKCLMRIDQDYMFYDIYGLPKRTHDVEQAWLSARRYLQCEEAYCFWLDDKSLQTPALNRFYYAKYNNDGMSNHSNPGQHVTFSNEKHSVIVLGPPGCGKTYLCNQHFEPVDFGHAMSSSGTYFIDDITTSPERLEQAKQLIAEQYSKPFAGCIVFTANPDSASWQNMRDDDRGMMMRRSHICKVTFTNSMHCLRYVRGKTLPQLFADRGHKPSDLDVRWEFAPGTPDDSELLKFNPCMASIVGVAGHVLGQVPVIEAVRQQTIVLPAPPAPALKIIFKTLNVQSITDLTILKRKDVSYVPLEVADYVAAGRFFLDMRNLFKTTVSCREQVATAINAAKLKNDTDYETAMLVMEGYTVGIDTIDGIVMAYDVDDAFHPKYEFSADGQFLWMNGVSYEIESKQDKAVFELIRRNVDPVKRMEKIVEPTPAQHAAHQPIPKFLEAIVAITDIVLYTGATGLILASAFNSEEECVEERGRRAPGGVQDRSLHSYGGEVYNNDREDAADDRHDRNMRSRGPRSQENDSDKKRIQDAIKRNLSIIACYRNTKVPAGYTKVYNASTHQFSLVKNGVSMPSGYKAMQNESVTNFVDPESVLFGHAKALQPKNPNNLHGIAFLPADACEFGWTDGNRVMRVQEVTPGKWTVFAYPKEQHPFIYVIETDEKPDPLMSNHLLGQTFDINESIPAGIEPHMDFGSILMTYVVGSSSAWDFARDVTYYAPWKDWPFTKQIKRTRRAEDTSAYREFEEQGCFDGQALNTLDILHDHTAEVLNSRGEVELNAVLIQKNIGITNAHAPEPFQIAFRGNNWPTKVIRKDKDNDIMLFEIADKTFSAVPSVMNTIITEAELTSFINNTSNRLPCILGVPRGPNKMVQRFGTAEAKLRAINSEKLEGSIHYDSELAHFGMTGLTQAGDCGSPLVLMNPKLTRRWAGIHARGHSSKSLAKPITSEYIEHLLSQKESDGTSSHSKRCDYVDYSEDGMCEQLGLHQIGTTKHKVHTPTTTTKYKTPLDLPRTHEPTIKSRCDPRNVDKRDMLLEGIARYANPNPIEDVKEEVEYAAQQVGSHLVGLMNARGMTTRIMSMTEAINGAPREEFPASKCMDRSGAVGFPYAQLTPGRSAKRDYLRQHERSLLHYFREDEASVRIRDDASNMIQDAARGLPWDILWVAYNKDEPQKIQKIYDAAKLKTRVFFSGPMHYNIAYRSAFGAALWRITELHNLTPVKVGLKSASLEWNELAFQHLSISPYAFASDMENWDGTVPLEFIEAIPTIYNIVYKHTDKDWKEEHDVMRTTLHKAVEGAKVIVKSKVYKLTQAMVSGCPGTAVENSLINWMLFYCCWRRIFGKNTPEAQFDYFMRHTKLSVFGDDNLCSVAQALQDRFNFNTFKVTAAKFGFVVTDAAKTGVEVPDQQPLEELEFLKRGFRKENDIYAAPLDLASINKELTWHNGPGAYEYKGEWRILHNFDSFQNGLLSTLQELSFHGKQVYEEKLAEIIKSARGTGITIVPRTYEEIVATTQLDYDAM